MLKFNLFSRLLWLVVLGLGVALGVPGRVAEAATYVVDTTSDNAGLTACTASPGDCSLRGAIIAANAAGGSDTITVPAGTYNLTIAGANENASATGDLDITSDLTINGNSAATTIIDAQDIDRVIDLIVPASATINVTLNNLTIQNGTNVGTSTESSGGGIAMRSIATSLGSVNFTLNSSIVQNNINNTVGSGGGLGLSRSATGAAPVIGINNSTIIGNSTTGTSSGNGAGIFCSTCSLIINNSLIANNTQAANASSGAVGGAGLYLTGTAGSATINHSTISGNTTNSSGGGLLIASGTATLNFVTAANNTADNDNDGGGNGGGLFQFSTGVLNIQSSLIAGNDDKSTPANDDCGGTITSQGYNAVATGTGCPSGGTGDDATAAAPSALADNGGATQTQAISGGHAAIDNVPSGSGGCIASTTRDQRGVIRADGSGGGSACDAGAYEADTSETFQQCSMTTAVYYTLSNGVGLKVNTAGTLNCLNMTRTASNHPNATSGLMTGQYWTLNPNGASGYNVDLTLPDSVVEPYACRYTGSGWDCAASVDNGGSVTRQGVTAFSDWTVGNDVGPTAVTLGQVSPGRIIPIYAFVALVALLGLTLFGWQRAVTRRS